MMNKLVYILGIAAFGLFFSCGGDQAEDAVDKLTDSLPQVEAQPEGSFQLPAEPTDNAAPATGNAGLNPAHGEPGHRCDIEVGAPLNSAPAQQAAPQVQQTQPAQNIQPNFSAPAVNAPAASKGKSGTINPAHGEPGHDCAVAVGAVIP